MDRFSKNKNPRFRFVPIPVKIEHGLLFERSDKNGDNLGLSSPKMAYGFLLKFSHRLGDIINVQIELTLNGQFFEVTDRLT